MEQGCGDVVRNEEFLCFFFFQAEDGIRDRTVTGVQTVLFRSTQKAIPVPPVRRPADSMPATASRTTRCLSKAGAPPKPAPAEIGRASCRERVANSVGGGAVKKKTRGGLSAGDQSIKTRTRGGK